MKFNQELNTFKKGKNNNLPNLKLIFRVNVKIKWHFDFEEISMWHYELESKKPIIN